MFLLKDPELPADSAELSHWVETIPAHNKET